MSPSGPGLGRASSPGRQVRLTAGHDGGMAASHSSPRFESKSARLEHPHVATLNAMVRQWRDGPGSPVVPWFDPDDAGTAARVLILMESPAPATAEMGAAAFCSLDNADRSNRTMRSVMTEVGLARSACVKWNVVPWVLPTRAPTVADIDAARPMLIAVLAQLSALEIVVTVGRPALHGLTRALWAGELPGLYRLVSTPHPSQRTALAAIAAADRLRATLTRVTEHIATTEG